MCNILYSRGCSRPDVYCRRHIIFFVAQATSERKIPGHVTSLYDTHCFFTAHRVLRAHATSRDQILISPYLWSFFSVSLPPPHPRFRLLILFIPTILRGRRTGLVYIVFRRFAIFVSHWTIAVASELKPKDKTKVPYHHIIHSTHTRAHTYTHDTHARAYKRIRQICFITFPRRTVRSMFYNVYTSLRYRARG